MFAAPVALIKYLVYLCAIALAVSNAAPAYAAPRLEETPAAAIESVLKTIDRAVAEVSRAIASQPDGSNALATEEGAEWQRFSADNAEIWLPASFTGGDLAQDLDMIVERLRDMGPNFTVMAEALEQNSSVLRLFAVDTEHAASGGLTNVTVGAERVLSFIDTELYLDVVTGLLPDQYVIREREQIELSGFEDANRAILDADLPGTPPIVQIMYIIKDNANTVWVVTFTARASELDAWLPVFQRSIESFAVTTE